MKRKTAKWLTAVLAFTMVMTAGCGKEKGAEKQTENTETVQETVIRETEPVQGNDLDMTGYNLVWEDDFEDGISEDDWNSIQETLYLCSIPGMRESILEASKEPLEESVKELDW